MTNLGMVTTFGVLIFTTTVGVAGAGDDPLLKNQWALENTGQIITVNPARKTTIVGKRNSDIRARKAWRMNSDCSSILVGVLDTGVDIKHEDLISNLRLDLGRNVVDYNPANFVDGMGHGSHVSGIIGAVGGNQVGVNGICAQAAIVPIKVCSDNGACPSSSILEGFAYAESLSAKGLRVTNSSFGGVYPIDKNFYGPDDQWIADELEDQAAAIRKMDEAGILFVAAAGNEQLDNDNPWFRAFPASHPIPNIISVAATNISDRLDSNYSNYGATTVHIAAPGTMILSTVPAAIFTAPPRGYAFFTGTSMASPQVAGAAALLMSYRPELSHHLAKQAIMKYADRLTYLRGKVISGGRLNLHRTLQYVDRLGK